MRLFSIIIPVYNTEEYLEQCLNSAIFQTYPNVEIIVINDASTDRSLEIIERLKANDERIILLNLNNNRGIGYARNLGISKASGDYVMFLDSDDWLNLNAISLLDYQLNIKSDEIIIYGHQFILGTKIKPHVPNVTYQDDLFRLFLLSGKEVGSTTWMYCCALTLLKNRNIRFSENLYYEDSYFVCQILYYANKIGVLSEVLYNYRARKGSIVNTRSIKHIEDGFASIDMIKSFLQEKGIYKKYVYEFNIRLLVDCIYRNVIIYLELPRDLRRKSNLIKELRLSGLLKRNNLNIIRNGYIDMEKHMECSSNSMEIYDNAYQVLRYVNNPYLYIILKINIMITKLINIVLKIKI